MARITNNIIEERVRSLQEKGHNISVKFEGNPSRPRIFNKGGDIPFSEHMPAPETAIWLDGFMNAMHSLK